MPLYFEANQGPTDERVKFISRGRGYALFLASTEAALLLHNPKPQLSGISQDRKSNVEAQDNEQTVIRMKFLGANPEPRIIGLEELPGKSNYFIGNDPKNWRANVPHYAKVKYQAIYPGIDVVFYGNQRELEFDFIVAPGADPNGIELAFEGAGRTEINDNGDLILHTPSGEVHFRKPSVYQESDGVQHEISGSYVLLSSAENINKSPQPLGVGQVEGRFQVGFQVATYDTSKPLIIDPVLAYSTYLGGNHNDFGLGIAVDLQGNAYVMGVSASSDFPLANPFQGINRNPSDLFIAKLNPSGSALVYSTYLGGNGHERTSADLIRRGIAVDAEGNAYVTGFTTSADFPTTSGVLQGALAGADTCIVNEIFQPCPDAFVTKLNTAGNGLMYSSYLGGKGHDEGRGIAVDSLGHAYVTGATTSTDFPITPGAFQTFNASGSTPGLEGDAFIAKLNPDGSDLVYSTFLGGSKSDGASGIAVDGLGNAYVTGGTNSTDFPTSVNAFQSLPEGGGSPCLLACDAFVVKLNPDGSDVIYSTYLGGSGDDAGSGIAVDAFGNTYVTGVVSSSDFPTTAGAFQTTFGGCPPGCPFGDVFVTKLNPVGSALIFSTYLGGSADDGASDIAIDSFSSAYVVGTTRSSDFPIVNAFQDNYGAGNTDAFVTKLNPEGSALDYSSYIGGDHFDLGFGIAVDSFGNAYMTGRTASADFPTTPGAFQTLQKDFFEAFVVKIGEPTGPLTIGASSLPEGEVNVAYAGDLEVTGGVPPYTVQLTKGTLPDGLAFGSPEINGTPTKAGSKSFTVTVTDQEDASVTKTFKMKIFKALSVTTKSLKKGKQGKKYTAAVKATGGKKPHTWSVSGDLPGGLDFDETTGKITGTPTQAGTFNVTFQVTDPLGGTDEESFTLTINEP